VFFRRAIQSYSSRGFVAMAMISVRSSSLGAMVLLVLLVSLLVVHSSVDSTADHAKQSTADAASAAQDSTNSWIDMAKDKLNLFSKGHTEATKSAEETATDAANVAGSKAQESKDAASGYWKTLSNRIKIISDSISRFGKGMAESGKVASEGIVGKATEGADYLKSTGSDAASKVYEGAQSVKDKAYRGAESATGKTQETATEVEGKSQTTYEATKEKLNEQYKAASAAINDQIKAASRLASDVGEKVKSVTGAKHEEL